MLISQQNPVIYFQAYQCVASLILKLPVTHLPFGFCSYASLFQSKIDRDFYFCVISLGYSLLSTADLMKNCSPWSHAFEQLVPVFGAVWGDCGIFRRQNLAGGRTSLRDGALEVVVSLYFLYWLSASIVLMNM